MEKIKNVSLYNEVSGSYLEYSLASIARAIPDYRDGLIPVYRRIIWAASEGFSSSSKHKKSAKLSGLTMSEFHPHSDSYGSIVSLTTNYNNNYPLLDGQGSFGDSTSPAASSRYTEIRLQKFTEDILLQEKDSLELKPNYDGSTYEPIYLNVRLPILLLRGSNSISVGYATNIPQYNLYDICDYLLGKYVDDLIPDFPTGSTIIYDKDKKNSILQRATISSEIAETVGKRKKKEYIRIEYINLPYNSNPEKIGEQIKSLCSKDLLPSDAIIAVDDLSDRNGDCISVTILKEFRDRAVELLYKYTDLQNSFSINFTVLVDNIPKVLDPKSYLDLWKKWRIERIIQYNSKKLELVDQEAKLLSDIIKVLKNKDKVIEILDNNALTYKQCVATIIDYYDISKTSADYFLNMAIKKLASLEITILEKEYNDKLSYMSKLSDIANNPEKKFKEEIKYLTSQYGKTRNSKITSSVTTTTTTATADTITSPAGRGFSLDYKRGFIIKGTEFYEKVLAIASNGKAYRISANIGYKALDSENIKILYAITDKEREKSEDILELIDSKNGLIKKVYLKDITATSVGTNLGFTHLDKCSLKKYNKSYKIKSKTAKPEAIAIAT